MTYRLIFLLFFCAGFCKAQLQTANGQQNLAKRVSFEAKSEKVSAVLQKMSTAGNFYFAYNGALFRQDSLVNLKVKSLPIRDVLDQLFEGKVDYREDRKYIILRYAVNHFAIEPDQITTAENLYMISGYVVDTQTGKKVKQASVYEKRLLQSALTNDEGYFNLKFKGEHSEIILTASKETYRDTAMVFLANIEIKPKGYDDPDKEKGAFFANAIEDLGISKFFLSSKQRIQNLNIPSFFATTPFQASLTPGLSSHGMMSSKIVNKLSLNVLGGYTAGVDGVELAGLFNLTKGEVKSLQIGGLFNLVGGDVEGVQVAGLINTVKGNVEGVQVAGLGNRVKDKLYGIQISGLANVVTGELHGMQISGLGNSSKEVKGMQIAGIFNYAKRNSGFQLGLINVADTSTGVSLGLINLVKTGYHKLSLSSDELINANVAIKTGNAKLYTILMAGKNFSDTAKIATFGIGFGHDIKAGKRLNVNTELTAQQLYLGNWEYSNILAKFQASLQLQLFKGLSIFAGPTYNYYISDAPTNSSATRYKQNIVPAKYQKIGDYKAWLGWNVGINLF